MGIEKGCALVTSESGAVKADCVVPTATVMGLGLVVVSSTRSGVGGLGSDIGSGLTSAPVA
ncbi:MAG: hypothetical protein KDK01_00565 [Rhodobacteraceae bacterium]|nr:hypothetical protein [Paracoccaceae bacterium]